jgi:hypothetical protein
MNIAIILSHTPTWVWVLLAFLLYRGVLALRPSTIRPARALLLPTIFLVWGLFGLTFDPGDPLSRAAGFVVAGGVGLALGRALAFARPAPIYQRETGLLEMPGSAMPLVVIVVVFVAKYALAVAMGFNPNLQSSMSFEALFGAVGGLSAGVLWGQRIAQFARAKAESGAPPFWALLSGRTATT